MTAGPLQGERMIIAAASCTLADGTTVSQGAFVTVDGLAGRWEFRAYETGPTGSSWCALVGPVDERGRHGVHGWRHVTLDRVHPLPVA